MERPDAEELVRAALFCLDRLGARENALRLAARFQKDHGERHDLTLMSGVLWYRRGNLEKAAVGVPREPSRSRRRTGVPTGTSGWCTGRPGVKEFADKFLAQGRRLKKRGGRRRGSPRGRRRRVEPNGRRAALPYFFFCCCFSISSCATARRAIGTW